MFRFILADVRRLWVGSLMMVLLIALAVALGATIILQERSLRLGSARASEKFDLVIGAPGSETQLVLSTVFLQPAALPLVSGDTLVDLQEDPRVTWAEPVGMGDFYKGIPVIGTTRRLIEEISPGFTEGVTFASGAEAVIGSAVPMDISATFAPSHGQVAHRGSEHSEIRYRITGRLAPTGTPWDRAILVPIQSVWNIHGFHAGDNAEEGAEAEAHSHDRGHDHADDPIANNDGVREQFHRGETPDLPAILVKPASIADAYKLRQQYRSNESTLAVFPAEVLTGLYGLLGNVSALLSYVSVAAQVLVGAALVMVSVIHVSQRRQNIGALRAFGAPRSSIFLLVWGQMVLLTVTGVILGLAGGWLAARLISAQVAKIQGFELPIEFARSDLITTLVLLIIAAIFAMLPAVIAFRQSAATSLRGAPG